MERAGGEAARGVFITLEGIDGAGKTTQARKLADWLRRCGHDPVLTCEPGGSEGGKRIAQLLATPPSGAPWPLAAETLLYYAARVHHLHFVVAPALERGAWVVCDRFADSSHAYQGGEGATTTPLLKTLDACVLGSCAPQLTFILDLAVAESRRRRAARPLGFSVIADPEETTLARARRRFLAIAERAPGRCVLIDAGDAVEDVHKKMSDIVRDRFASRFHGDASPFRRAAGS